jgi:hypothetical protein
MADLTPEEPSSEESLLGIREEDGALNRKRAFLAVLPFLALGLADVLMLLIWGLDPLWGFMILPPILFISVLAWIAFRTGFAADRTDTEDDPA